MRRPIAVCIRHIPRMRVKYDGGADAFYVDFAPGEASEMISVSELDGDMVLKRDSGGLLLGIEIYGASYFLPREVLRSAELL